jgi:hypothetical protein
MPERQRLAALCAAIVIALMSVPLDEAPTAKSDRLIDRAEAAQLLRYQTRDATQEACAVPCQAPRQPAGALQPGGHRALFADEAEATIEPREVKLWPCGYTAKCSALGCCRRATTILRYLDNQGRLDRQIDACDTHARELSAEMKVIDRKRRPG